jgi:D-lyxose ketol-isomerase
VLCSNGVFSAAQDDLVVSKTKKITDKLNAHLLMKARCSNEITHLASPVTGGGVSVPRFQQLFILSIQQGKKKPEEWASDVWQILTIQRQKIVKEGKTLETIEENLAEIKEQAILFAEKKLPILKALQIA